MRKCINISFFGDSICVGQGISIHRGWVTQISHSLAQVGERNNADIVVVNSSVNGNTTRLALERIPYDIQSHHFDVIIIQFGMNDCNFWKTDGGLPRVSKRAFEANLHEIIERCTVSGIKKIFLNTNHPTQRFSKMPPSNMPYQESNAAYNEIIRTVSSEKDAVVLIDVERSIYSYAEENACPLSDIVLPDLLHLSQLGHDIYYRLIYPRIEAVVMELLS